MNYKGVTMKWDIIGKQLIFEPGDIVCVHTKGLISQLIRKFTRSKGEEPTIFNHVGIMVHKIHLVEALRRVYVNRLTRYNTPSCEILIARRKGLSENQKAILLDKAFDYVGRDYGFLKIFGHSLDCFLTKIFESEISFFRTKVFKMDRYPICSWVVAWCYDKIEINFGVEKERCQPDDIADDILQHNRDKYEILFATDLSVFPG